jgi:hypothetical protein
MTKRRRWSASLEAQRQGAEQNARAAADLLDAATTKIARATTVLRSNPDLAERLLAEASALVSRAQANSERVIRLMIEAAHGLDD